jgi:hypothetical protein
LKCQRVLEKWAVKNRRCDVLNERDGGLEMLRDDVQGLGEFLRELVAPVIWNQILPAGESCCPIATLPEELLQRILGFLSAEALLRVARVDRRIRSAVLDSKIIRRRLGLVLPPALETNRFFSITLAELAFPELDVRSEIYTPAQPVASPLIMHRPPPVLYESTPTIKVTFVLCATSKTARFPRVGSPYRSMLLTQPPLHSMTVATNNCCCQPSPWYDGPSTFIFTGAHYPTQAPGPPTPDPSFPRVSSATGLTLGDLLDATGGVVETHRLCPRANWTELNDDGYVRVGVKFVGIVEVRSDDPVIVSKGVQAQMEGFQARASDEERQREEMMKRYSEAKREGMSLWFR